MKIYNSTMWAIFARGRHIHISNNYVEGCVMRNENCKSTNGWEQCLATNAISAYGPIMSENVTFENNEVYHSWGEGMDLILCSNCIARGNYFHDIFPIMFYSDNGRNLLIENNIFRQSNGSLKGCGSVSYHAISFGNEKWPKDPVATVNMTVKNNFIWGTYNGVSYFGGSDIAHYSDINVIFNTFWKLKGCALQFLEEPVLKGNTNNCVFKNNFVYSPNDYFSAAVNENYTKFWNVSANVYYGVNRIQLKDTWNGTDGKAHSIRFNLTESGPLEFFGGGAYGNCSNESYWNVDVQTYCFIPNNKSVLYHMGVDAGYKEMEGKIEKDYFGCARNRVRPSIGYSEGDFICISKSATLGSTIILLFSVIIGII
ncbi:hypothetical protein EIN_465160 [Entamoeba invadens IP1]|uniref:Right handed beta helix domain-containing protein n=1 Tax=Entamoeba invadens IP1 TaxID=370355 RepID=A0A0A1TWI8_ENTIV|nr:hypothetical protein EIN_465160 [Entamoeba invadens IP1]ELP85518.1 hypothetical protein EIN_465160 [Entamoeba invadens IP1]|eukprot:XP_004184864.1 hypothetical protein EIN_465160 [Entamoeba invadens IP1]